MELGINKIPNYKIYKPNKKKGYYREFINNYILPYLEECGYEEVNNVYPTREMKFFKKGCESIIFNTRLLGNYSFFIVCHKDEIIGTIIYDRVYPEFYSYLFKMDLFGIYNPDLSKEIKHFIKLEDFYEEKMYFSRKRTKPIGDNPVSRIVHYSEFYERDKVKNKIYEIKQV